jgi:micrococcal nuclease
MSLHAWKKLCLFSLALNVVFFVAFVFSGKIAISLPTTSTAETPSKSEERTVSLVRVVDGDTILVRDRGVTEYVRFIGIDAPEENKTTTHTPECFAEKASAFLRTTLAETHDIRLIFDVGQGERDTYGRLLAYPFLGETDLGELLVRNGYAREFTFRTLYDRQSVYKKAEREAKQASAGLWGECIK